MTPFSRMLATALACLAAAMVPATAFAYVGPGAGLSLLGALWALIAALGTAVLFVAAWPIRKMLRRRRQRQRAEQHQHTEHAEHPLPGE